MQQQGRQLIEILLQMRIVNQLIHTTEEVRQQKEIDLWKETINRNLDAEATYSYACPDEINETPGLRNKEGVSRSISYQNRECE